MPTIFTQIINGRLPGHFVWKDDRCVSFLSINPLARGHALVVPIDEVDHWLDLPEDLNAHLMAVGQRVGQAQMTAFSPARVGLMIAGLEVPHVHLHLVPMNGVHDLDFANAATSVDDRDLQSARAALVAALWDAGADPGV